MDIRGHDLGLLASLNVLLEETNGSKAAERLGISQPALSAQLARLRDLFGDALLLPASSGKGMVPTTRAIELGQPLRAALQTLGDAVSTPARFDAATAIRTFTIAANDNATAMLGVRLNERVATRFPGLRIAFRSVGKAELPALLESGDVDIAWVSKEAIPRGGSSKALLREEFRMAQRLAHPRGTGPAVRSKTRRFSQSQQERKPSSAYERVTDMLPAEISIPATLKAALDAETAKTKRTPSNIVTEALSRYLGISIHTLFQVSTSGALVAGVFDAEVSVGTILEHGDFGLGTFAELDGEMVILDGRAYQVHGTGVVSEAGPQAGAPFAVVTRFSPQTDVKTGAVRSFKDLEAECDRYRSSGNNIFYAVRLDGHFRRVRTRAVNPPKPGTRLVDAAKAQSEFTFDEIDGTLVGLWSPGFSSAFSVAGYHFHFLSDDRRHGGHLLDVDAGPLRIRLEALTDFHLALPESEAFLKADLSRNTAEELAYAEQAH